MHLNDFFGPMFCINLDRRPDRWERVRRRFERHGVGPVTRFPAVDGKQVDIPDRWDDVPGAYGCLLSHLGVVRAAREAGAGSVLIFEDDVIFDERFSENFATMAAQVPDDWDMLLLGGSHWSPPSKVTENVSRVVATVATHAYALRDTLFDSFIRLNLDSRQPVDCNNTILQAESRCYCFCPPLVYQEDGYSDIAESMLRFARPGGPSTAGGAP